MCFHYNAPRGQPPQPVARYTVPGICGPSRLPAFRTLKEKEMNKLLSVIVAAMFAVVSASAFAASHAGAQMKDEKKMEKAEKKKAAPKKKAAAKKDGEMKKGEGKKKA